MKSSSDFIPEVAGMKNFGPASLISLISWRR